RMHTRFIALLVLLIHGAALAGFRAGVATVTITPTEPTWAAGYADRNRPISETLQDLYAKALVLEDADGRRIVIVTTDLLGLPKNIADPVAAEIARRHNLTRDQIVLSSSHTHCGPVLREALVDIYPMTPEHWAVVERYSRTLHDK